MTPGCSSCSPLKTKTSTNLELGLPVVVSLPLWTLGNKLEEHQAHLTGELHLSSPPLILKLHLSLTLKPRSPWLQFKFSSAFITDVCQSRTGWKKRFCHPTSQSGSISSSAIFSQCRKSTTVNYQINAR